jgi:hypothetical protein
VSRTSRASRTHLNHSESRTVSKEANKTLEVRQQTAAPYGGPTPAGDGRRLGCGCSLAEIKWCPVHACAAELLYELGAIADALENDIEIVIQPGSVRHQQIQKVVAKADGMPKAIKAVRRG